MRRRICLVVALMTLTAFGWLRSYEVMPTQAAWSGWTNLHSPNDWVGNTFIANFDSITEVQVFVGYLGANPSTPFKVDVNEYPGGNLVAYNGGVAADREHS